MKNKLKLLNAAMCHKMKEMKKYRPQILAICFSWMIAIELLIATWLRLNVIKDPSYDFAFIVGGGTVVATNFIVGFVTVINSKQD